MIITTTSGAIFNLIQFTLREGQSSAPVTIRVTPENVGEKLTTQYEAEVALWGKIGAGAYVNIVSTPIDLNPFLGGYVDILIKGIAANSVPGVVKKYLFLGGILASPAGWLA